MKHLFTQHREAINSDFVFQLEGNGISNDALVAELENDKKLAEKSTETIDTSKSDQIECKKECLTAVDISDLPEYSKDTVKYMKETVSGMSVKSEKVQKYVVDCTTKACVEGNKKSTLSGIAQSLGFPLVEGAMVSVNGAKEEPIKYTKEITRKVTNKENLSGKCDDVSIKFRDSNFTIIQPGQFVTVINGVLHITDKEITSTTESEKYYQENTNGTWKEVENPGVAFDENGEYEKTTYLKNGEETEQNEYKAGLKINADKKALANVSDAEVEDFIEHKNLQGGSALETTDVADLVSDLESDGVKHAEHLASIKKYQDVLRNEFARVFDTKTGLVGLVNSIGKIENTLVEKMEKAGIPKEVFKAIYKAEQIKLQNNQVVLDEGTKNNLKEKYQMTNDQFNAAMDGQFDQFDKIQYKSWKEDLVNVAVGLCFGGVNIPVINVNTGRRAEAMDLNAVTDALGLGSYSEKLTDIVQLSEKATDGIIDMAATKSALQGSFDEKSFAKLKENAEQFELNQDDEQKSLYEVQQEILDIREGREASQTKKQKNTIFKFSERIWNKNNKSYRRAQKIVGAKTYNDLPKRAEKKFAAETVGMGEQEKNTYFEQFKVQALKNIRTVVQSEFDEDILKKRNKKPTKTAEMTARSNYLAELDRMIDVHDRLATNMSKADVTKAVLDGLDSDQDKQWKAAVVNFLTDYKTQDGLELFLTKNQTEALAGTEKFYNAKTVEEKMNALSELKDTPAFVASLGDYSSGLEGNTVSSYLESLEADERRDIEECLSGNCNLVADFYDGRSVRYVTQGGVTVTVPLNFATTSVTETVTNKGSNDAVGGAGVGSIGLLDDLVSEGVSTSQVTEEVTKLVFGTGEQAATGMGASMLTNKIFGDKDRYNSYPNVNITDSAEGKASAVESKGVEENEINVEKVSLADIKLALGQVVSAKNMIPLYENFLANNKDHVEYQSIQQALVSAKGKLAKSSSVTKKTQDSRESTNGNNEKETTTPKLNIGDKITLDQIKTFESETKSLKLKMNGDHLKSDFLKNENNLKLINVSKLKYDKNGKIRKIVFERDMKGPSIIGGINIASKPGADGTLNYLSGMNEADKNYLEEFMKNSENSSISKFPPNVFATIRKGFEVNKKLKNVDAKVSAIEKDSTSLEKKLEPVSLLEIDNAAKNDTPETDMIPLYKGFLANYTETDGKIAARLDAALKLVKE